MGDPEQRPHPPFQFVEENLGGTNPKIEVRDSRQRRWIVKWSEEVHSEAFASRLVWALGYFVRPTYFIPKGTIQGVRNLKRARSHVENDGTFQDAAFKLISEELPYLAGHNWSWTDNPFLATRLGRQQLNGLKILTMLVSNWDTKDTRDVSDGANTAIYRTTGRGKTVRFLYAVDDWGASMGRWGNFLTREKWDCEGYTAQTPRFVTGVDEGHVKWGYTGKNTEDITKHISLEDARWFLQYFTGLTAKQIEEALRSSGAEDDEVDCFSQAIRERISQLENVATVEESKKP